MSKIAITISWVFMMINIFFKSCFSILRQDLVYTNLVSTLLWSWVVLKPMSLLPQFPWIPGLIHHVGLRWLCLKLHADSIKRGKAGVTDLEGVQNRDVCALSDTADWPLNCWEGRTFLRREEWEAVVFLPFRSSEWIPHCLTLWVWLLGPDQLFASASPLLSCPRVKVIDENLPLWTCTINVLWILIASTLGDGAPENTWDKRWLLVDACILLPLEETCEVQATPFSYTEPPG